MFNVTTRYVKINDERKKCFMVRGDEAYASTVDVEISNSTPVSMEYAGFKTTLTVTLHRHRGSSTLTIYDGKEILGILDTTQSTTTYTLSDVVLAWGVEHELYAVYNSNKYTRRGKSRKIALTQSIPSDLKTEMEFTTAPAQINEGTSSATFEVTVTQPSTLTDGTLVYFYDGSTLIGSSGTEDNIATITLDEPSKGRHNIRAEIQQSTSLNGVSIDHEMLVGYDVTITEYPTNETFIIGSDNTVKVQVLDMKSEPVSSASVSYNGITVPTNSSGIATFTVNSISGTSASATYSGSSSEAKPVRTFTPTGITTTKLKNDVVINMSNTISATINGTSTNGGTCDGLTIKFEYYRYSSGNRVVYQTNNSQITNNVATSSYVGTGRGTVNLDVFFGDLTVPVSFRDSRYCYTSETKYIKCLYRSGCAISELSTYRLEFSGNGSNAQFRNYDAQNVFFHPYNFEFEVVSNSENKEFKIDRGSSAYTFTPTANQRYKFKQTTDNEFTVYVNDVEVGSCSGKSREYGWRLISDYANVLTLTNVRIY